MADAVGCRSWQAVIMTIALYAQLALLALIDSTSIGTLLIPLWLLMRPDTRHVFPRIMLYLGVLAGFYLMVGIAILSGAGWAMGSMDAGSLTQIPAIQWVMVIGGGALLAYALRPDPAKKRAKVALAAGTVDGGSGTPGVPVPAAELKWQKRLSKALRSPGGMVGLAVVAGLLELPTMVPYLVAIGFLSNSTLPLPGSIGLLVAYCLLMLVPALILLGLRAAAGTKLDPILSRVSAKMGKFSGETVVWVLGIVGFLLLRGGLAALAPAAAWNPFK